jgi:hypothetical protein
MATSATEDIIRMHRSLVSIASDRPEYQPGKESALYGYSEGVEHGMEILLANGYQKMEYARSVDDLTALAVGVSIFDGKSTFTVSAGYPVASRAWIGNPDDGWFPETHESAAAHLPAMILRPAATAAAPNEPMKAIETVKTAQ